MPTYDYQCNGCGHVFELFQQMTDRVKRKCPACNEKKLERLIGIGSGVLFKGGGFYETEYRSEGYKKAEKKEKESKESSGSKGKKSSEKIKSGKGSSVESKKGTKSSKEASS